MAERRMFAKTIIDSDAFLELPITAQLLYFHLAMRADDDGFVNKPRSIMRVTGVRDEDIRTLINNKFVIAFDSGVVVIKHWRIHNYIQKDRYSESKYKFEKAQLYLDENKSYSLTPQDGKHLSIPSVSTMDTECIQTVYTSDTQDRLGKDIDSLVKDIDSIEIESEEEVAGETPDAPTESKPRGSAQMDYISKMKSSFRLGYLDMGLVYVDLASGEGININAADVLTDSIAELLKAGNKDKANSLVEQAKAKSITINRNECKRRAGLM